MLNATLRALAGAALATLSLLTAASAAPAHSHLRESMTLAAGVEALPLAAESRDGYQRTSFKHWIDEDHDGCSTRNEVLIAESRVPAESGPGCKILSGEWFSYYDQQTLTNPRGLDIDHMVPLAEAWDSGASQWTAARRQAYANDLGAERSLVAVTARTNRSKADQDPAQWLPPSVDARCTYAADWVETKLRWELAADRDEARVLREMAGGCGQQRIEYEHAQG
ncbi:HNH endonuclease family protein [Streptomyces sp. NPDC050315]|uniref:HNH endonuclease family protein n=1 Tax=Streptomyces sp. NPDC050315 TaxID=3155039 RepID=UPI0034344DE0